jgi:hypothetical protein
MVMKTAGNEKLYMLSAICAIQEWSRVIYQLVNHASVCLKSRLHQFLAHARASVNKSQWPLAAAVASPLAGPKNVPYATSSIGNANAEHLSQSTLLSVLHVKPRAQNRAQNGSVRKTVASRRTDRPELSAPNVASLIVVMRNAATVKSILKENVQTVSDPVR